MSQCPDADHIDTWQGEIRNACQIDATRYLDDSRLVDHGHRLLDLWR